MHFSLSAFQEVSIKPFFLLFALFLSPPFLSRFINFDWVWQWIRLGWCEKNIFNTIQGVPRENPIECAKDLDWNLVKAEGDEYFLHFFNDLYFTELWQYQPEPETKPIHLSNTYKHLLYKGSLTKIKLVINSQGLNSNSFLRLTFGIITYLIIIMLIFW